MLNHTAKAKCWRVAPEPDAKSAAEVARALGISLGAARLLCTRGLDTPEAAKSFIGKETGRLHDPFLMADMDRAVERIKFALENHERITVYGDYDVDGVTSVSILYSYLKSRNADVSYYIPSRIGEGYGVNADALKSFVADGCKLMITVDTGITAIDEIAKAKSLGLDTVVTDHHECREELPDCPVVNPRRGDCPYPFKELAGVGVAFKLICALEKALFADSLYDAVKYALVNFGELVSIGTIADVMPLIDENRIIASCGLSMLEHTKNTGIRALLRASGVIEQLADGRSLLKKKITSSLVGYTLAPRINAAGRISNATFAVELFLTENPSRAYEIADSLCAINRERQSQENDITKQADAMIAECASPGDHVIVLDSDHWHHGVIGIVCSRLTERFDLPSILVSFEGQSSDPPSDADIGKGSGRSVKGFNLVEALGKCSEYLVKYGGHELAAGLSIERGKLNDFRRAINALAAEAFAEHEPERIVDIDLVIPSHEISMKLCEDLYLLEPFGVANSQPVFETDRFIITEVVPLAQGKHTKLTLRADDHLFTALCFGTPTAELGFSQGERVDLCYNLDINEFRGHKTVQLITRDIRKSNETLTCPSRDDFARLWRTLSAYKRGGVEYFTLARLSDSAKLTESQCEVMLDIFAELSLIRVIRTGVELSVSIIPIEGKMELGRSQIYRKLQENSDSD